MLIMSIILAIVTMALVATIFEAIETNGTFTVDDDSERIERRFSGSKALWAKNKLWVIAAGVIVGVINYSIPKLGSANGWLALVFMALLIALQVSLLTYWRKNGSNIREAVPFVLLTVLLFFIMSSTAWAISMLVISKFVTSLITTIPAVVLVASLGFIVVDLLYFQSREIDEDETSRSRRLTLGRVAIVVTLAIIVVLLATMVSWGSLGEIDNVSQANADEDTTGNARQANASEDAADGWLHFYNLDVASDDDPDNDFNFGPSAYTEGADAKSVDAEFRKRLKVDTALAAASTAVVDAKVKTRYLGEFYESCKGDWAKTMNSAKERWSNDQTSYYEELDAFFKFLDAAEKVEIRDCQLVSDQMYMNPYTASGNPDVIVLKTDDHSGHELVYTWKVKDDEFSVAFRLECGFQPTDVAELMNITPTTIEDLTSTTTTSGGGTPSGDTPTSEDDLSRNKNPNLAPKKNTEPNDDSGPGPNTNSGGNSSTEEKSTNSNKYSSYEEYRKDTDNLNDTNANQKVGGDSNTSSTPSGSASVDSNADAGTGHGGVDKATEVTKPAKEAATGTSIDSTPGEAWGGPSD